MTGILTLYSGGTSTTKSNITFSKYQTGTKILQQGDDLGDFTITMPPDSGTLCTREWVGGVGGMIDWKSWYNSIITPSTADQTITVNRGISSIYEVMIGLYYSSQYRQTFIFSRDMINNSLVFPDFYWAGARLYFNINKVSNTQIKISNAGSQGSIGWGQVQIGLFYK